MADASVQGGVSHSPADARQALPSLTPQEERAAQQALAKLGSGSGALTSSATGSATPYGAGGNDSVMVGSGRATLISGTHHSSLMSGADSVVAGSAIGPHAAGTVPGGHGSGFQLRADTIHQAGPTAAGFKGGTQHGPVAGVTMPDHTKINVSGLSPAHIVKHTGHG